VQLIDETHVLEVRTVRSNRKTVTGVVVSDPVRGRSGWRVAKAAARIRIGS